MQPAAEKLCCLCWPVLGGLHVLRAEDLETHARTSGERGGVQTAPATAPAFYSRKGSMHGIVIDAKGEGDA